MQAEGNVKDNSNQRVVAFDYGLPTANQLAGFTLEIDDLAGFQAYAEVDINTGESNNIGEKASQTLFTGVFSDDLRVATCNHCKL